MAYVLIKSEERRSAEQEVLNSFHKDASDVSNREFAECAAARAQEALRELEGRSK